MEIKLNKSVATDKGLITAVATKKEGFDIFVLILQSSGINTIIGQAFSERKILNLAYKTAHNVSEYTGY